MYYFWTSDITIRMRLADLASLGGFGQGGRTMRIARLEREGYGVRHEDLEVTGCVAVIVAESYRRFLEGQKKEREVLEDLTLESIWMR